MSKKMTAQQWHDEYFKALARERVLLVALEACITHDGALAERNHTFAIKRLCAISDIARAAIAQAKGV